MLFFYTYSVIIMFLFWCSTSTCWPSLEKEQDCANVQDSSWKHRRMQAMKLLLVPWLREFRLSSGLCSLSSLTLWQGIPCLWKDCIILFHFILERNSHLTLLRVYCSLCSQELLMIELRKYWGREGCQRLDLSRMPVRPLHCLPYYLYSSSFHFLKDIQLITGKKKPGENF